MIGNFNFFFLNYVYGHCQFWEILFLKEIILPKASMTLIPPPRGSNVLALSVYTKKTNAFLRGADKILEIGSHNN